LAGGAGGGLGGGVGVRVGAHRDGEGNAHAPLAAGSVHAVAEVRLVTLTPEGDVVLVRLRLRLRVRLRLRLRLRLRVRVRLRLRLRLRLRVRARASPVRGEARTGGWQNKTCLGPCLLLAWGWRPVGLTSPRVVVVLLRPSTHSVSSVPHQPAWPAGPEPASSSSTSSIVAASSCGLPLFELPPDSLPGQGLGLGLGLRVKG